MVTLGRHIDPGVLTYTLHWQREQLTAAGADRYLLATLDYGIAVTRTTIRWLDRLPAELTRRRTPTRTPTGPRPGPRARLCWNGNVTCGER